ncbi:hypothetical protein ACTXT7_009463 [Hymenolepis weldensis]
MANPEPYSYLSYIISFFEFSPGVPPVLLDQNTTSLMTVLVPNNRQTVRSDVRSRIGRADGRPGDKI